MNEHTVLAKDLGSALLDVEVESLAEFIFQLIDHGVIAFKNRAGQLEESEMVRYGQEVLIHHNPLQLAYVKATFRKLLIDHLKGQWDLNAPEQHLGAHSLQHRPGRMNPLLEAACRTHALDPKFVCRFLPTTWNAIIHPFAVKFLCEDGPQEARVMKQTTLYEWDGKLTVADNLRAWSAQPMRYFHCTFCIRKWNEIGKNGPVKICLYNHYAHMMPMYQGL